MNILALPALADNYIWMLHNGQQAIVVDPGDATPVIQALQQYHLQLAAIWVTHHHTDHVGGIETLRPYLQGQVYGPATEAISEPYQPLREGDALSLFGLITTVLDVPGHTAGHIAYHVQEQNSSDRNGFVPIVFTGDVLFSVGCGRLFEGNAAQMLGSLDKLAALAPATRVCCGHEYTISNLRFAQVVEPDNADLAAYGVHCQQLRAQQLPTLPSTIEQELCINPFLRTRKSSIIRAVQAHAHLTTAQATDEVSVFAALRHWKDHFK